MSFEASREDISTKICGSGRSNTIYSALVLMLLVLLSPVAAIAGYPLNLDKTSGLMLPVYAEVVQGQESGKPSSLPLGSSQEARPEIFAEEQLMPTFSVTRFGAIPDDSLDDTEGFQKTIDTAIKNNTGSGKSVRVLIPSGNYILSREVRLSSNLVVAGEGRDNTVITWDHPDPTKSVFRATGKPDSLVRNLVLRDFWIMGTGAETMGRCIEITRGVDFLIENTRLTGCGGSPNGGAIYTTFSSHGAVIHNIIERSRNGYITPAYLVSDPTVPNGELSDFLADLERLNFTRTRAGSENMLIAYNVITNSSDDAIHPQGGFNNRIIGNIAIDSGDDNIDTFSEKNAIIENNTIIMNKLSVHVNGFEIGDNSENIVLRNNTVVGGAAYGINLASDPSFLPELGIDAIVNRNITITGNEITGTTLGCLRTFYSENVLITDNSFYRCNTISTLESEPEISEPEKPFTDVGENALQTERLLLRPQGGYSLLLSSQSVNVTIVKNLIEYIGSKKTSSGIYLRDPTDVYIAENRIELAKEDSIWDGDAIYVAPTVDNVRIERNDLSACGCMIEVQSSRPNISITVLESTTTLQTVRNPFSFEIEVQNVHGNATYYPIAGASVIHVLDIKARSEPERKVTVYLDRGPGIVKLAGSLDIAIPKQVMNSIIGTFAFANSTATIHEADDSIRKGGIMFEDGISKEVLPFQKLSENATYTTVRIALSQSIDRVEITGVGTLEDGDSSITQRLQSLGTMQTLLLGGVAVLIAGSGSTILFLKKRTGLKERDV